MHAATVVYQRFTASPSTLRRAVNRTIGISANGMPKDSSTWLSTSARGRVEPDGEDGQRRDQRDQAAQHAAGCGCAAGRA